MLKRPYIKLIIGPRGWEYESVKYDQCAEKTLYWSQGFRM